MDLPLSVGCKRVLTYGAEEAERLNHKHIGTEHLLLGLLREEKCFAAQLLGEQGLTLDWVRKQLQQSEPSLAEGGSASFPRFAQWLAEREARGGFCIVTRKPGANRTPQFAFYAVDQEKKNQEDQDMAAAEKLVQIQNRIHLIVERMERAIANHEFERARFYSDEKRKEREKFALAARGVQPGRKDYRRKSRSSASRSSATSVSPRCKNAATIALAKVLPRSGCWTPV